MIDEHRGVFTCRSSTLAVMPIWPVSWTITHHFGVSERFSWLMNPRVRFRIGHQHSQFWPIPAHFVDYYSPFLGPGVIFMVVEPQGAPTCRPSSLAVLGDSGLFHGLLLAVLADSGTFRGLLLVVLGCRSDLHD